MLDHHKNDCFKHYKNCHSLCCRSVIVQLPFMPDQDTKLWAALHKIVKDINEDFYYIPCRCRWLDKHGKCTNYPQRPKICKKWECELLKKDKLIPNHGTISQEKKNIR